jgi:hypothetical protein
MLETILTYKPSNPLLYIYIDDENVSLMDTRYMGRAQRPLWKSGKLGGGIWRIKWHPYTANRMLVGAMHAGCCVLDFHGTGLDPTEASPMSAPRDASSYDKEGEEENWAVKCTKKFAEHDSMVYGSDWLVCPHPTQNGYFEAAARYAEKVEQFVHFKSFYSSKHLIISEYLTSLLTSTFLSQFPLAVAHFMTGRYIFGTQSRGLDLITEN